MQTYTPLPQIATPPKQKGAPEIRVCDQCGEPKPLNAIYYRPRRKGETIFVLTCRECEKANRRDQRELQAETTEENTLESPNTRIVKEYVPERIDKIEIAALAAAEELGVDFASDDAWGEFCEAVDLQADWAFLDQPEEFKAVALALLNDRN